MKLKLPLNHSWDEAVGGRLDTAIHHEETGGNHGDPHDLRLTRCRLSFLGFCIAHTGASNSRNLTALCGTVVGALHRYGLRTASRTVGL